VRTDVIKTLLIANRGEIARRIMQTCRRMGISTVAVYSDADAEAPFVAEADRAVRLGPPPAAESYLRIDRILEAAGRTGADAIHPGYGFLAENADFARAVLDAGLTWVGPSPEAIATMGSKLGAKRLMVEAGVPTLPSAEVDPSDPAALLEAAKGIGYPVLVKASAGGGGKGMRIVRSSDELVAAAEGAAREAASAFGDPTLFVEKYLEAPRHVEVQIFGDASGRVVALFERECSIQRRHQQVVEESPSPAVDEELRARLGAAAVRAGEAVAYVGAGTVEFLLDTDGRFFFLEANTRLQVEHPVTELVTGLDLVRLQLEVAEGASLPPEATSPTLTGHAIEVRLYAEDAVGGFLPQTGTVHGFSVPDTVRVDSAVEPGTVVGVHYDPMLAKVIAWAPTRPEAARLLAGALRRARIHGVVTNRDLLVRVLEEGEFLAGSTDTHYFDRHDPASLGRPLVEGVALARHAAAAALVAQARRRRTATAQGSIPSGWRNSPSQPQRIDFMSAGGSVSVGYLFGRSGLSLTIDDDPLPDVDLVAEGLDGVVLSVDGVRAEYLVSHHGDHWFVDGPEGGSTFVESPRFPVAEEEGTAGSLLSPMPGKIVRVLTVVGAEVAKGEALVVVEAMKMEHSVRSPSAGTVAEVRVAEGDQVDGDQVLVVVEEGSG
jgi:propionyl-CoA carboxylase alpha chain